MAVETNVSRWKEKGKEEKILVAWDKNNTSAIICMAGVEIKSILAVKQEKGVM